MNPNRSLLFYTITIVVFGSLMFWISELGKDLESKKFQVVQAAPELQSSNSFTQFSESFVNNLHHPLATLVLQVIAIIIVSRVFGYLFNKIGQPTVIGEILAGITLGPSLLGLFYPEISTFLFPVASLSNLQFLSQVGLMLFMFVIGMELDVKVLRNQAREAVVISHASIVIPYFLGMFLAFFLYEEFAPANITFLSFSLFMGIAMSITAFPVLARVIQERGLTKTKLGTIAITCAAADDVTAWCILAAVIAIAKAGSITSSLYTIGLSSVYLVFMIYLMRPFLRKLGTIYSNKETISKMIVAIVFIMMLLSSYLTEVIGIHVLFGAFLAGVIMPPISSFRKILTEKIEDVSLVLLLPLFFVFTGLRTQIGLLNETHLWAVCGWIILTAVVGKFGGSAIAARIVGQSWKDSLSLGALMNTRGLMELIVLNIGYDLGILSPEIFAMMVLMALVTTFMTGPSLDLINFIFKDKKEDNRGDKPYRILISFGPAEKGRKLLRLADQLTHSQSQTDITAFHLTPSADINPKEAKEYERESFIPVRNEAEQLNISINTLYKATNDISKEIASVANKGEYDLLLVGGSRSLFTDDVTGGKVKNYLEAANCQVGILVDKDFNVADTILMPILDGSDFFVLSFAERFIQNNKAKVKLVDVGDFVKNNDTFLNVLKKVNEENPNSITLIEKCDMDKDFLNQFDLMVISHNHWKSDSKNKATWLAHAPSVLIIKP